MAGLSSHHLSIVAAFALGACAATATRSSASSTPAGAHSDGARPDGARPDGAGSPTDRGGVAAGAVVPLAAAARRIAPSGKARVAILAEGRNAFVARLEMDPGAAVPEHRDATEEYIHVLEGGGTITIDGAEHEVSTGATIYMPANARVSFQNGPAPLVGLQVFAGPEPAAKYDAWTPAP